MKKWTLTLISGVLVTVVSGILLHFLLRKDPTNETEDIGSSKKGDPVIHFQEVQNKEFHAEISYTNDGEKGPTTVWAYLDLDEGKHNRDNCDLMVHTTFFDQEDGYSMRSMNSDLETVSGGKCPEIDQNANGSNTTRLAMNREYCIRTNQGRLASIVFHRILTSWGKYATIEIRMTIRSYSLD